jgi:hypothetical protein
MFTNAINFYENLQFANTENYEALPSAFTSKELVIGCINFIGNLYNEKILTLKIITYCCMIIISKIESDVNLLLDLLLQLLTTIGDKFCKESPDVNEIFGKLNVLKDNVNLSKKDKFAIMDLLDAKLKNKWN